MDFADIDKNLPDGKNMGGLPQIVYFCLHTDVLTFPTEPKMSDEDITLEKMGELVGDLTLKEGKKCILFTSRTMKENSISRAWGKRMERASPRN